MLAVEIPKSHGDGVRVLGVPTVADRIAQAVVAARLEKVVEPKFHVDSYGYRPGRSALDAVARCRERCWGHDWVIDLDIQKFFDSVPMARRPNETGKPRRGQRSRPCWLTCSCTTRSTRGWTAVSVGAVRALRR